MKHGRQTAQRGAMGSVALTVFGLASAVAAQQPPALGPQPPPLPAPAAATSSTPTLEAKTLPPALGNQRLVDVLQPRAGGLRADEVARRAEITSPEVLAKQREVEAAAAKVDQAAISFAPRLSMLARYTRLSPITMPSLGYIVGAQSPAPIRSQCGAAANLPPDQCIVVNAGAYAFTFPVLLDMYTLQGSLVVPLSDYVLRLSQNYAAATRSKSAANLQERATRAKVQRDARLVFFNWARARGGVVVAEQGLSAVHAHLKDVNAAVVVGMASKADYLRVESQVAATELLVERTRNLVTLVEEQLRTMLHDPPETTYEIGENVLIAPPPGEPAGMTELLREALEQRLEVRALDDTVYSLRETKKVVEAGYLPRLDAVGNLYYQNPNTRYFPQTPVWNMTWDVSVQLSWTINDTFATHAQAAEIEAKAAGIEAQKSMLRDGIRLEVMQAYNALREAQVALETTVRQLTASEESYRVRRELFRAGRATSAELTDAETDLMRSRLEALNAKADAVIARVNLDHALGRDIAMAATARRP